MDWRKKTVLVTLLVNQTSEMTSVAVFCRKSKIELRLNSDEKIDTETGSIA